MSALQNVKGNSMGLLQARAPRRGEDAARVECWAAEAAAATGEEGSGEFAARAWSPSSTSPSS